MPTEALGYGFLGSYLFVLQSTVRRYFSVDLRSRSYVNAIARIVLVSALVIVLHLVIYQNTPPEQFLAISFLVGFFPDLGFAAIAAAVGQVGRSSQRRLGNSYPLSKLDGLNVFYEYRLFEEGIEDMQHLITADLPNLILNTKIPLGRLVDWIDQAILYIRLVDINKKIEPAQLELRRFGIRTATDLLDMLEVTKCDAPNLNSQLLQVLQADNGPSVVESLRWSLLQDTKLEPVRGWKEHMRLEGRKAEPASLVHDSARRSE